MAESEEIQEEIALEDRSLHLLLESEIDQEFSQAKNPKKGGKKHKMRWMKRPMAIPEVILELLDEDFRENALRCLSGYLLERREDDPENYYRSGYLLYNSCATMTILLQEVVMFFGKMADGSLDIRSSKRLANVLTLFQSIAANKETRQKFVNSRVPNYLIPLILSESPLEVFENVRVVALSVIGILCQASEPQIIQWAVENNVLELCLITLETGSELSKVIGMHILEAILRDEFGIEYLCSSCDDLLTVLMKSWEKLVSLLATHQDFSPRLLFHIIRCYVLLCNHVQGFSIVTDSLPHVITDGSFDEIAEVYHLHPNGVSGNWEFTPPTSADRRQITVKVLELEWLLEHALYCAFTSSSA